MLLSYDHFDDATTDPLWKQWPNFTPKELACSGTGRLSIDTEVLDRLQKIRNIMGPLKVTSFYRSPEYNNQVSSTGRNGPHTTGKAVDVQVSGEQASEFLFLAMQLGFTGIGVNQKGSHSSRFIHVDTLTKPHAPRPWVWSY